MRRALLLALLLAAPTLGQELGPLEQRAFVAGPRFAAGEQWTTCGGLRLRVAPVDAPPLETSIAFTQSVLVVDHPVVGDGFALRALVTSIAHETRRPDGVLCLRAWDEGQPGLFADAADRTWTWTFLPGWDLARVSGPGPSLRRLLGRVLAGGEEGAERALDEQLVRLGQPVREVQASLERGPILPGATWGLEGGRARYLGADWACAHFAAAWELGPGRTLEARFTIDGARRVTWLDVQEARVAGGVRVVEELAFGLVRVHGAEEPAWEPDPFGR